MENLQGESAFCRGLIEHGLHFTRYHKLPYINRSVLRPFGGKIGG